MKTYDKNGKLTERICKRCGQVVDRKGYICSNCLPKKPEPLKIVICPKCGKEFKQKVKVHTFCSYECKYSYQFKSIAVREERKCVECGKTFVSTKANHYFCSKRCECTHSEKKKGYRQPEILRKGNSTSNEIAYLNRIRSKSSSLEYIGGWDSKFAYFICNDCGAPFKHSLEFTHHTGKRCYCPNCKNILSSIREKEKEEEREKKQREQERQRILKEIRKEETQTVFKRCRTCNSLFYSPNAKTKYCSKKCATAQNWKVRDLYRYAVPLDKLYERDRGVCHICGGICDWNDKYINKDGYVVYGDCYPSRDHIVEKCGGGEHTWENIKLAHRKCNTERWIKYDTTEKRRIKEKIC